MDLDNNARWEKLIKILRKNHFWSKPQKSPQSHGWSLLFPPPHIWVESTLVEFFHWKYIDRVYFFVTFIYFTDFILYI